MKSTLETPSARVIPNPRPQSEAPTWEYCFVLQEEWSSGTELTQLAAAGWFVVSFRTRLDNHREYLLKRQK